ncbi:MAG: hypothetical protein HGB01_06340 [Chlorobiaceae bacterium]|nr:hypothetical protein [Chlorobiaceae bacterium]
MVIIKAIPETAHRITLNKNLDEAWLTAVFALRLLGYMVVNMHGAIL